MQSEILFNEALEVELAERSRWLRARCDDATLVARVEALLEADASNGDGLLDDFGLDNADVRLPARVGEYEIIRVIGEGGMGIVC